MKARRMAYWWFRFVVSGRFLEKFLKLRRRDDGRSWSHPLTQRSWPDVMRFAGADRGVAADARVPRSGESRRTAG